MKRSFLTTMIAMVSIAAFSASASAYSAGLPQMNAAASAGAVFDDDGGQITGSWKMVVTSDTFPVPFRTLITFDAGGGVIGSAQGDILLSPPPGVPPGATAAHGAWRRTGDKKVQFTLHQIFYNADGGYAGGAKIQNVGKLSGGSMVGTFVVRYYDANDQEVFVGQGSFTASRIGVESPAP